MDLFTIYGLFELLFLVVKVWAVISWLRLPGWAWQASGRGRGLWLVLLVVAFFLPLVGFVLALWFVLATSVDVRRAAMLGRAPGFPGGP